MTAIGRIWSKLLGHLPPRAEPGDKKPLLGTKFEIKCNIGSSTTYYVWTNDLLDQ